MERWRFVNTGSLDAAMNMAIDRTLLRGVADDVSPPTVRVYAWQPPAVSTGHAQDVEREIDVAACARAGVDVVRRPTGGRAVLHSGELTYSVAGRSGDSLLGGTISDTYRVIALALLAVLRRLGVCASLAPAGSEPRADRRGPSPPCFASSGRFEIVVDGRKLVGSAQYRHRNAILQHGSLLIDSTHTAIADFLRLRDGREREAVRTTLRAKTTDLCSVLGSAVGFDDVARAMQEGFQEAWGVPLENEALSGVELDGARLLASEQRARC